MKVVGTIEKKNDPKLISIMKKALDKVIFLDNKIIVSTYGSTGIKVEFGGVYEKDKNSN